MIKKLRKFTAILVVLAMVVFVLPSGVMAEESGFGRMIPAANVAVVSTDVDGMRLGQQIAGFPISIAYSDPITSESSRLQDAAISDGQGLNYQRVFLSSRANMIAQFEKEYILTVTSTGNERGKRLLKIPCFSGLTMSIADQIRNQRNEEKEKRTAKIHFSTSSFDTICFCRRSPGHSRLPSAGEEG